MTARIIPFPHPYSVTDATGAEISHYEIFQSPRIVVEITEGAEIINAHLTIRQAEDLSAALLAQNGAAKRGHLASIELAMQRTQRAIAAAGGDNLPPGSGA